MTADQHDRVLVDPRALRRARLAAKLRQEDLSAALGADQSYVSKVERGHIGYRAFTVDASVGTG